MPWLLHLLIDMALTFHIQPHDDSQRAPRRRTRRTWENMTGYIFSLKIVDSASTIVSVPQGGETEGKWA